ncbi:MAG: hypothetical protein ACKVU1_15395 [bacterium]
MTLDEPITIRNETSRRLASGAIKRVVRALGAVALAALATVACGCGDDDDENPMVPDANEPDRSTPVALLTTFFEVAYSSQDSTLYRAMLDSQFTFEFLAADADSLRNVLGPFSDAWNISKDVQSTYAMFGDSSVTGITLNLLVNSNDALPDTIGCVGCRRLEATVTMRVATIRDGTEPLIFTVDSPQTFVAKKDPADSTRWVLWRQFDRPRSEPGAFGKVSATESSSWGKIKGLFYPAPPAPDPRRDTPDRLLNNFFEAAYRRQDSALYSEMLDPNFQFEFLQADADSLRDLLGEGNFWGTTLDLRSTGNMFRSPDVTGVTLNLLVYTNNEYLGDNCVGCRQLEAEVALRIATVGDGTEPLTYAIDSPQTFVAKLDPADSLWVLFRQLDRPRSIPKSGTERSEPTVESASWGKIKGIFR